MDKHARWYQKQFVSWVEERLQKEVPVEAQHLEGTALALTLIRKGLEEEQKQKNGTKQEQK